MTLLCMTSSKRSRAWLSVNFCHRLSTLQNSTDALCALQRHPLHSFLHSIAMAADTSDPVSLTQTSPTANDPSKTGYDPDRPWSNLWNILTNRMTPLGQFHYREETYINREAEDCKNCEEWRDWCFKYSPTVIFLQKNIRDLNGDLNADNVRCRRMPARIVGIEKDESGNEQIKTYRQGGGFNPEHGVLLCANELRNKKHLEDTLAHEMVHAWDHLRWKMDWADLKHAACTEVCCLTQGRWKKS